jgi:Domain of unknown function (DUF3854)
VLGLRRPDLTQRPSGPGAGIPGPLSSKVIDVNILDQHRGLLEAAAVSIELAERAGVRSAVKAEDLPPGQRLSWGNLVPGLLFPWQLDGITEWQLRPDNPPGDTPKYLFRLGAKRVMWQLHDPGTGLVLLIEGTKQALAAATYAPEGAAVYGLAGCWGWTRQPLTFTKGRPVVVVFDGDVATNRDVWDAAAKLTEALRLAGATSIKFAELPTTGTDGLDDWLAHQPHAERAEMLARLIDGANGKLPRKPAKRKRRDSAHDTPSDSPATVPPPPTDPPALASDLRILDRFKVAVRHRGVVGEETTACIAYLVLTSRLLDKQASLAVKGHSASGKSFTVETTVAFFPPEARIVMTAMSERSLIYSPEDYSHRTLVVYEATALREGLEDNLTAYLVRSLLSEGRIEYPVTVKDRDGNFTTKTIIKEGPTNLILTTTKVAVHAENETRVLSITTDDSRDQTARVLAALADETERNGNLEEWHQLQRWLTAAEHRVTIPYAGKLAELVPPVAVRLRRDFGTLLALIRAHAILHQQTRQRDDDGRIVASLDDYAVVRELVSDIMAAGVDATVSTTVRETVEAVAALVPDDKADPATALQVANKLGLDKSAARRRLLAAADGGYVRNVEEHKGRPGRWELGEPLPGGTTLLPESTALATDPEPEPPGQESSGGSGGTVASESEGVEGDGCQECRHYPDHTSWCSRWALDLADPELLKLLAMGEQDYTGPPMDVWEEWLLFPQLTPAHIGARSLAPASEPGWIAGGGVAFQLRDACTCTGREDIHSSVIDHCADCGGRLRDEDDIESWLGGGRHRHCAETRQADERGDPVRKS